MRRSLTLLLVFVQFLVLAYMAGHREYIVRTGESIYLRTAPIDPRDIFRGDFVRLHYEISTFQASQLELDESSRRKGQRVYARLSPITESLYGLNSLTDVEPKEGLFIRGRIVSNYPLSRVDVRYGIEQLFVEQGKGLEIEERMGRRGTHQIPMEVSVALSGSGIGIIKGYRWSKLAVKLQVTPARRRGIASAIRGEIERPLSPKLKLTLKNVSEKTVALFNPGDSCGFDIIAVGSIANEDLRSAYQGCDDLFPDDSDVVELAPEQEYTAELDLSEPRWHVLHNGEVNEFGRLNLSWRNRFRILYRRPDPSSLVELSAEEPIWDGYLLSPSFTVTGEVD